MHQRLEAEEASWSARCEALRQSLQKQEAHSAALEAQLASRPTAQQVHGNVIVLVTLPANRLLGRSIGWCLQSS